MIAKAKILNGNILYERISDFYAQIQIFEGQEVEIEIRKKKKLRSNNQNKFYWGIVLPTVRQGLIDAGYFMHNDEQVHELLKFKFLKANITNEDTGETMETVGSTTTMSTAEFESYITEIRIWAAEYLNINITAPNE